jgi:hypothetical protein
MSPMSAEATVVRNYLDWLLSLPWGKKKEGQADIEAARPCSNEDHYGLEKVKERILEYLAVQQRAKKLRGRSCASSALRASARPRSASRSRRRRAANSCACRSAACATKPKSAATAGPISARCRARSSSR